MHSETSCQIHSMELGPMENFVYLLHDTASNRAAVVDPAWDVPAVLAKSVAIDAEITDVFLTHSHHDHVNGIEELLAATDAQVHLLKPEMDFWQATHIKPTLHHGGDEIKLGDTTIELLHTPGHTPGSTCYRINDDLITGDTLFVFGCGRCDLNGGNPEEMFNTLKHLATDLPAGTTIFPGHNYSVKEKSTLQEQIDGNPFMHFDRLDEFVRYRLVDHDRTRESPYAAVHRHD